MCIFACKCMCFKGGDWIRYYFTPPNFKSPTEKIFFFNCTCTPPFTSLHIYLLSDHPLCQSNFLKMFNISYIVINMEAKGYHYLKEWMCLMFNAEFMVQTFKNS